jgi:hypothetical protein
MLVYRSNVLRKYFEKLVRKTATNIFNICILILGHAINFDATGMTTTVFGCKYMVAY